MAGKETHLTGKEIKELLANLRCPFTWEIAEIAALHSWQSENDATVDNDEELDIKIMMHLLNKCYENVMDVEMVKAKKELEKCEDYYLQICDRLELREIKRGIKHVIDGTRCHYLYKNDEMEELERFIRTAVQIEQLNDEEKGAVNGCESVVWTMYYDFGVDKALESSSEAIRLNQNYPLWHLIRGINLRRQRRKLTIHSAPNEEELTCFSVAWEKSKDPAYAICYAQMLREKTYCIKNRNQYDWIRQCEREIIEIYKNIYYDSNPSVNTLLKMALGFMRITSSHESTSWAKRCLDKVAETSQEDPTYLYYMGFLHESNSNYQEAVVYFERAANYNNCIAELKYVNHAHKLGILENPTQYLLTMLDKYKSYMKDRKQLILLGVATSFYKVDKNMEKAAEYYLKAIELDPTGKNLMTPYSFLGLMTKKKGVRIGSSIYHFLEYTLLDQPRAVIEAENEASRNIRTSIQNHCDNYNRSRIQVLDHLPL